jgi:hypothetical protein
MWHRFILLGICNNMMAPSGYSSGLSGSIKYTENYLAASKLSTHHGGLCGDTYFEGSYVTRCQKLSSDYVDVRKYPIFLKELYDNSKMC